MYSFISFCSVSVCCICSSFCFVLSVSSMFSLVCSVYMFYKKFILCWSVYVYFMNIFFLLCICMLYVHCICFSLYVICIFYIVLCLYCTGIDSISCTVQVARCCMLSPFCSVYYIRYTYFSVIICIIFWINCPNSFNVRYILSN